MVSRDGVIGLDLSATKLITSPAATYYSLPVTRQGNIDFTAQSTRGDRLRGSWRDTRAGTLCWCNESFHRDRVSH